MFSAFPQELPRSVRSAFNVKFQTRLRSGKNQRRQIGSQIRARLEHSASPWCALGARLGMQPATCTMQHWKVRAESSNAHERPLKKFWSFLQKIHSFYARRSYWGPSTVYVRYHWFNIDISAAVQVPSHIFCCQKTSSVSVTRDQWRWQH